MSFGVAVVLFLAILLGGVAVGMLLSLARPRDEEAAAMHREHARRVMAWLAHRYPSVQVRPQPKGDSGSGR
jgi:hypothetical protein